MKAFPQLKEQLSANSNPNHPLCSEALEIKEAQLAKEEMEQTESDASGMDSPLRV